MYFAGAKKQGEKILTNGGRVLGVTAVAETLEGAVKKAYSAADKVKFDNEYMRTDIGKRALSADI